MAENPYQSIIAGIESGSQWAMRAHQLKIQKEEAERAAETHKITQMAAKFKMGEMAIDKLKYITVLENGLEKDTHIKMFGDMMAGSGYPVHPATMAALKDKSRRQDWLNALSEINSLDQEKAWRAVSSLVDILPREDGMNLLKTFYEKQAAIRAAAALAGQKATGAQINDLKQYLVDPADQRALFGELGTEMQQAAIIKAASIKATQKTEEHSAKIENIGSQVDTRGRNATTAEKRANTQQQNVDSLKGVREKQKQDIDSKIGLRSKQGEDIDSKIKDRGDQLDLKKQHLVLMREKLIQDKTKTTEALIREIKNDANKLETKYEPLFTAQETVYKLAQMPPNGLVDATLMGRYQTLREGVQSVLREGEIKDIKSADSLLNRISTTLDNMQVGSRLSPDQRKALMELARLSRKVTEESARNALSPGWERAQKRGLDTKEIFNPNFRRIMSKSSQMTVYPSAAPAAPAASAQPGVYGPPAPTANPRLDTVKKFLEMNAANRDAAINALRQKGFDAELKTLGIQ